MVSCPSFSSSIFSDICYRGTLSKTEKKSYIDAVKCLQSKPSKSPASFAAGAKTRFDDWVAVHLNQTQAIHYTGNFLTWHRYFTWLYEEALRNECGYKGTQPVSKLTILQTTLTNILVVLGLGSHCP